MSEVKTESEVRIEFVKISDNRIKILTLIGDKLIAERVVKVVPDSTELSDAEEPLAKK